MLKTYLSVIFLLVTVSILTSVSYAANAETGISELGDVEQQRKFDQLIAQAENEDIKLDSLNTIVSFLDSLKKAIPEGDSVRHRHYEYYACMAGYGSKYNELSETPVEELIEEARQANDHVAVARFYYCLSHVQIAQSKWTKSIETMRQAANFFRELEKPVLLAYTLEQRCTISSLIGQYADALKDCFEAKNLFEQYKGKAASEELLFSIGIAYRRVGFDDRALKYFEDAAEYAARNQMELGKIQIMLQKSYVFHERENYEEALELQNKALELSNQKSIFAEVGNIHIAKASALNELGRYQEALSELERAKNILLLQGVTDNVDSIELQAGIALNGLEQPEKALQHLGSAEKLLTEGGNRRYLVWLYDAKAKTYKALGRNEDAVEALKQQQLLLESQNEEKSDQQLQILRYQFDIERQELENNRLKAEQELKTSELESLKKARKWQTAAIILASILAGLLLLIAVKQIKLSRRLKKLAMTDSLTGIANRRHIEQYCDDILAQTEINNGLASIIVFDIDHFKNINDQYGHDVGDEVLKEISRYSSEMLRRGDRLGRYGGEEFMVVLPNADIENAYRAAERLRTGIQNLKFNAAREPVSVTVSIGIAAFQYGETRDELVKRADQALYWAKRDGRNRTKRADQEVDNI